MSDCDANSDLPQRIVRFLQEIGLETRTCPLPEPTFLPGLRITRGRLDYDPERLRHPGDLLHEAGHLACKTPEERARADGAVTNDAGEEMAAIAWSFAAARHLRLPLEVVFHEEGYLGGSASLIENFSQGRYFGVPLLQWYGLTLEAGPAEEQHQRPFPHMLHWLRA